ARPVLVRRMDDHSRRLVHHDERIVFIDHVQIDGFRLGTAAPRLRLKVRHLFRHFRGAPQLTAYRSPLVSDADFRPRQRSGRFVSVNRYHEWMALFTSELKLRLPQPEKALPGRSTTMDVPDSHFVNG